MASLHPPHLTTADNDIMPSAFIPFCSYQSEALGEPVPGAKYIGCNHFLPTSFNGQLCYSLKEELKGETKQGKRNGLLLMIDPGHIGEIQREDEERPPFEVYIHTLSGFTGYQAGSYALDSLKQMTGTSGFMNLPDKQKRCQFGDREECRQLELMTQFELQCGCIPWAINTNLREKVNFVRFIFSVFFLLFPGQKLQPCTTNVH